MSKDPSDNNRASLNSANKVEKINIHMCVCVYSKEEEEEKYRSRTIDHRFAQKHYTHTQEKKK